VIFQHFPTITFIPLSHYELISSFLYTWKTLTPTTLSNGYFDTL